MPWTGRRRAGASTWPGWSSGSEGTLALVTQAILRTVPIAGGPGGRGPAVRPARRRRGGGARECLAMGLDPSACDLFDWRLLSLARDADPRFRDWIAEAAESVLIVEFEGDDPDEVAGKVRLLVERIGRRRPARRRARRGRPPGRVRAAAGPPAARRAAADEGRGARPGRSRSSRTWRCRPDCLAGRDPAAPGHPQAPRGELDARRPRRRRPAPPPAVPRPGRPARPGQARAAGDRGLRGRPRAAGGTISGEHGCGLARTQFLRRQYGELVQVFREVKDAFDPSNLLNPGKVIGDDPHLMTRDLKPFPALPATAPDLGSLAGLDSGTGSGLVRVPETSTPRHARRRLDAAAGEPDAPDPAARPSSRSSAGPTRARWRWPSACNGCGACRTLRADAADVPDLPRPPAARRPRPRSQANLLRQVATGQVDPKLWGTEEFKANADLCIHCKLCRTECPAGRRRLEPDARGQGRVRREPRPAPGRLDALAVELWARLASRFPILSNALLSSRGGPLADRAAARALAAPEAAPGPAGPRSPAGPTGSA